MGKILQAVFGALLFLSRVDYASTEIFGFQW